MHRFIALKSVVGFKSPGQFYLEANFHKSGETLGNCNEISLGSHL